MKASNIDPAVFEDMRPYRDDEVRAVLDRMINDKEAARAMAHFLVPGYASKLERPFAWMVRQFLRFQLRNVTNVYEFQEVIASYMGKVIDRSTSALTISGLDELPKDRACLFVSNHRDIAMDPALSIISMYRKGHNTARIAIGDNLLSKQFAADLMKLNKCFVVTRNAGSRREKLAAATRLSNYIYHSVVNDNEHVWIAQRSGRAKDGLDRTNPALLAMFSMTKDKETPFADFWRKLHIVPLAISYEWDPGDRSKAREVYVKTHEGEYQKGKHEDLGSIGKGVMGYKGHVHAAFGTPIEADFADVTEMAEEIDRQIINNYVLHATNLIAYEMLYRETPKLDYSYPARPWDPAENEAVREKFEARLAKASPELRDLILAQYANPVVSRLAYNND